MASSTYEVYALASNKDNIDKSFDALVEEYKFVTDTSSASVIQKIKEMESAAILRRPNESIIPYLMTTQSGNVHTCRETAFNYIEKIRNQCSFSGNYIPFGYINYVREQSKPLTDEHMKSMEKFYMKYNPPVKMEFDYERKSVAISYRIRSALDTGEVGILLWIFRQSWILDQIHEHVRSGGWLFVLGFLEYKFLTDRLYSNTSNPGPAQNLFCHYMRNKNRDESYINPLVPYTITGASSIAGRYLNGQILYKWYDSLYAPLKKAGKLNFEWGYLSSPLRQTVTVLDEIRTASTDKEAAAVVEKFERMYSKIPKEGQEVKEGSIAAISFSDYVSTLLDDEDDEDYWDEDEEEGYDD